MKILDFFGSLPAGVLSSDAQSAEILLPSPVQDSGPKASGRDLRINPYDSSVTGGVFLAIESNWLDHSSIFRLTPTDAVLGTSIGGGFIGDCYDHSHRHPNNRSVQLPIRDNARLFRLRQA